MKEQGRWYFGSFLFAILFIFLPLHAHGQGGPPVPTIPDGIPLGWWRFDDTNWNTFFRKPPLSFTNLELSASWDGNAVQIDSTNAAWLRYAAVDDSGWTNLNIVTGTVEFWFRPNWNSADAGGSGPGGWARLIEVGNFTSNANYGWWSLYLDAAGTNIYFSSQTNSGTGSNFLSAPISWDSSTWHMIALTYSTSNSALYIDGALVAAGDAICIRPGPDVLTNGFLVGSDSNGVAQARGQFEDLFTSSYAHDQTAILFDYTLYAPLTSPPILTEGGGGAQSNNGPSGPPGSEGGGSGGPELSSSEPFDTNGLWLQIQYATNEFNTDTNGVIIYLHNTMPDIAYQLLSKIPLDATNEWIVEQNLLGAPDTNVTVTTVSMTNRPTLYFRALAFSLDSDGDGLPDWWELKYGLDPNNPDTGNTGILDGYKLAPSADGLTYAEKFQSGTSPYTFSSPRAPTDFKATLGTNGTSVILTWSPASGPVLHYIIKRADPISLAFLGDFTQIAEINPTNLAVDGGAFTVAEPLSEEAGSQYSIEAVYAGGISSVSIAEINALAHEYSVNARSIRGPDGRWKIAFSAIPALVQSLRISFISWRIDVGGYDIALMTNVAISNLADLVFSIPDNFSTNLLDTIVAVQGIGPEGKLGTITHAGAISGDAPYFVDGRQHLKENLGFLMRGAGSTLAFPNETWPFTETTSFAQASYYHPSRLTVPDHLTVDDFIALDNIFPFALNHLLAFYLYNPTNSLEEFDWHPDLNPIPVPAALGLPDPYWIRIFHDATDWGLTVGEDSASLSSGANVFGLAWQSNQIWGVHPGVVSALLHISPGATLSPFPWDVGEYWSQTASPNLQTIDYYFARLNTPGTALNAYSGWFPSPTQIHPLPLDDTFPTSSQSPLLIGSAGQPMVIAAWAKQQINNGASGKYGYLGQYFERAYKIGTNGVATTNTTGILSPYGEFLPTEPGPVALVTMTNWGVNERGTAIVHVIKLQLDVNHDGIMDLSFAGPDNTSADRPFRFWLNNDHDEPATASRPDRDIEDGRHPDFIQGNVRCQRNLEDFARLWIRGVPAFPLSQGYSAVLSIRNASGDPKIKLYYANQTNGDTGYLHDVNAAARQFDQEFLGQQLMLDYARSVGEVSTISSYSLPIGVSSGDLVKSNFLFEGSGSGSGELLLTVSKGNLILAESSQWIEITDISKLIEFATVTNVTQSWPEMVNQQKTSGFKLVGSPRAQPDSKEIAVFVHGWRMPEFEYTNFSETMFKRLYWEGFQGRFATLRWPTRSAETDPFLGLNYATFNRSEHIAFDSGAGTAAYLNSLRNRFSDYTISVCCHSMGAVVMMEALRQLAQANSQPINNLVLMQGAIAAQVFDTNVTNYPPFVELEQSIPTPNLYSNYGTNISAALRSGGKIVNFFNPSDFALGLWQVNQSLHTTYSNETVTIKPNTFFGYYTDGVTNTLRPNIFNQTIKSAIYGGYYGDGPTRSVTNAYEVMPFISRPRTLAVGVVAGVSGEIQGGEFNLKTPVGFGIGPEDHSGEFNRNIQEAQVDQFYPELKRQLFPVQ